MIPILTVKSGNPTEKFTKEKCNLFHTVNVMMLSREGL